MRTRRESQSYIEGKSEKQAFVETSFMKTWFIQNIHIIYHWNEKNINFNLFLLRLGLSAFDIQYVAMEIDKEIAYCRETQPIQKMQSCTSLFETQIKQKKTLNTSCLLHPKAQHMTRQFQKCKISHRSFCKFVLKLTKFEEEIFSGHPVRSSEVTIQNGRCLFVVIPR